VVAAGLCGLGGSLYWFTRSPAQPDLPSPSFVEPAPLPAAQDSAEELPPEPHARNARELPVGRTAEPPQLSAAAKPAASDSREADLPARDPTAKHAAPRERPPESEPTKDQAGARERVRVQPQPAESLREEPAKNKAPTTALDDPDVEALGGRL
jgi:hypothetical protein